MYNWNTLLYTWNWHSIVSELQKWNPVSDYSRKKILLMAKSIKELWLLYTYLEKVISTSALLAYSLLWREVYALQKV